MRRRGCLISFGALVGLALICCVLLIFVGLPRFQDSIADSISESLSTEIADQINLPGDLQPGTYTISVAELEEQFANQSNVENVEDFRFSAQNGSLTLSFGTQGQSFDYSGTPVAQDGRLELTDVEATGGGFLDRLFPADKLANAVEDGVNHYFEAQDLRILSVTAENDELQFEVAPAGA